MTILVKGALPRLHTLLSGICLSNVPSLCNKLEEFKLLMGKRDFSSSSVLCFMETWLLS